MAQVPALVDGIQRLEISNFKSYRQDTIGPFAPFTAIVGPNGSGKSNVMDAISFVLGVKTNQLRGANMRELINHEARNEGKGAYVKMFYQRKGQTQLIEFRHSIRPDGVSEYRVDNKVVTLEGYRERLERLGFNLKSKNFLVFQGDVESLASKSPKDLTTLIEQIAGSDQYKADYEAALAEKEKEEENTFFIFQKKKGLNAERKQFKEQKEEAERFNKLLEQRANLKREYVLFQLFHIEKEFKTTLEDMEQQQSQLDKQSEQLKKLEARLAEKKKEQAAVHREYLKSKERLKNIQQQQETNRPELIKAKEQVAHVNKRLSSTQAMLQKVQEEYDQHNTEVKMLQRNLEEVRRAADEFKAEMERLARSDVQLTDAQLREYNEKKQQVLSETSQIGEELEKAKREQITDTETRNALEVKIKEYEERKVQQEENLANNNERKAMLQQWIKDVEGQLASLKAQLAEVAKGNQQAAKRRETLRKGIEECEEKLKEFKVDRRESQRDQKFAECLESLKRLFPGVHGRLIDLCKPVQKKFNMALTVTMGRNMDAIIVDSQRTAAECVTYMTEQRFGIATFLPLDSIVVKPINEKLRQLPSNTAKLVFDIVKCDPIYQRAVLYATGNTIVCDTLEEARKLAFRGRERHKVVTIEGVLIRKSGVITGGSHGMEGRAARWNARTVEELKHKRDGYLREMEELLASMRTVATEQDITSQMAGYQETLKYHRIDLDSIEEKIKANQGEIKKLDGELKKLLPQLQALTASIDKRGKTIEKLEAQRQKTEDRVFAEFSKRLRIGNIREWEEARRRRQQERAQKEVDYSNQTSRLENQLEYEASRNLEEPLERLKKAIREDEQELKRLEKAAAKLEKEEQNLQASYEKELQQCVDVKKSVDEKDLEIKAAKKDITQAQAQNQSVQKQITAKETQLEQLRTRRHNLLTQCKVEEIKIPIEGDVEDEAEPMDVEGEEASQVLHAIHEKEDRIVINFEELDVSEDLSASDIESTNAEYIARIQAMTTTIENMAPNMKAIARFDDVMERLKDINAEFENARAAAKAAAEKFQEIKAQRYKSFTTALEAISKNVEEVYLQLTKRINKENQVISGTAYLTVENTEEPYNGGIKYYARPPGKRFVDIEALSGGEKTLAALALLFAFHKFRRAPFFVLDEIDAALDGNNAKAVARFIEKKSQEIQFVLVSLKPITFSSANALIGVCNDAASSSSKTFTVNLDDPQWARMAEEVVAEVEAERAQTV